MPPSLNDHHLFTPECASEIAHGDHYYHLYCRVGWGWGSIGSLLALQIACSHYKRILQNTRSRYAHSVQAKFEYKDLVPLSSRKYRIKFLNREKSSKPAIINNAESIIFLYDKARLFAITLASNCFFKWWQPFTRLPPSQGSQTVISKRWKLPDFLKCLDTKKATGPDKISVIVIKNIKLYLQYWRCYLITAWRAQIKCVTFFF